MKLNNMWRSFVRKLKKEAAYRKRFWLIAVLLMVAACCIGYVVHYYRTLDRQEALYEELRVTEASETVMIEAEVRSRHFLTGPQSGRPPGLSGLPVYEQVQSEGFLRLQYGHLRT